MSAFVCAWHIMCEVDAMYTYTDKYVCIYLLYLCVFVWFERDRQRKNRDGVQYTISPLTRTRMQDKRG